MLIEFGCLLLTKPSRGGEGPFFDFLTMNVVLVKTSDVHNKISKTRTSNKCQIVHYSRLKPVKEEVDQRRVLSRPAPGRGQATSETYDMEETADQGTFSENPARRILPRNTERHRWLE